MAVEIPYPYIHGLDPRQQQEIYRDFEAVLAQIVGSATPFDAVIDSELAVSTPSSHRYKNLTDLNANEVWSGHFIVGVRQGTTAITEPSTISLSGKGSISLIGFGSILTNTSGSLTGVTPWAWKTVGTDAGQMLYLQGLWIQPAAPATIGTLAVTAVDCNFFDQVTNLVNGSNGCQGVAVNCTFAATQALNGGVGVTVTNVFYSCTLGNGASATGNGCSINVYGGLCGGFTANTNRQHFVFADFNGGALSVIGSGGGVFNNTGAEGSSVTVSDPSNVNVYGAWASVSFTGTPTASGLRLFDGSCSGSTDFTGPGHVIVAMRGTGSRLQCKGDSVNAEATISTAIATGVSATFNAVGLTNSLVKMTVGPGNGAGSKPWAFDAASHNNILIIAGTKSALFTTAGTDAGTANRIITETSDSLVSSAPTLSPSLLNGEIAAVQSGMQTIPTPGGSAPTGAAGGSLAGTYPNPTFAGRDASVDAINKDLLPALLVPGDGVQTIPTPTTSSGGSSNLDGGYPSAVYGGTTSVDGGTP